MNQEPINVCITYDDNFEPLCSQLCSNLKIPGIRVRLNKTESIGYDLGFRTQNWYMNLSEKIAFVRKIMDDIEYDDIICSSDADIQFFKPEHLFKVRSMMCNFNIEYAGQREQDMDLFNGGFFLVKKNKRMIDFLDTIASEDLTKYEFAEQDMINKLIPSMGIKHRYLSRTEYFNGCRKFALSPKISNFMVMHHATCAFNAQEKMSQMNFVRQTLQMNTIDWREHVGY